MKQHIGSQSDIEVAINAARAGAAVLMDMYGRPLSRQQKSATDFATDADIAAEQAILTVISDARPQDAVLGEELGQSGDASSRRTWLVDPLCGTLNFAAETPLFSVNIALRIDDAVPVAAVGEPISGKVYWAADSACGVELADRTGPLTPTASSGLIDINADGSLVRAPVGPALILDTKFRAVFGPRVSSTTLALAWVASGQRAGYVTDGHHANSVHFAAALCLCQAAGCVVSDLHGGSVHTGPGIVAAANSAIHAELLSFVNRHGRPPTGHMSD